MIVDSLKETIEKGKNGLNIGLSTGLDKLDMLTYGLNRGWMYTWCADSGAGKSSLVLYTTVYQPFQQYLASDRTININFLLFSFELSAEVLLTKLLSIYMWDTYKVEASYDTILSLSEPIDDNKYSYVKKSMEWLYELEKHCTIIDKPVTAKHMYGICKEWTKQFGKYNETELGDYVKEDYVPNDPQQWLIVNVDHIKLLKTDAGNSAKQEIDDASNYLITLRNKCKLTVNIVQQLNRNFKSVARRQECVNRSGLQLDDLSDSSGPSQASEVVIGIWHPYREHQPRCENYDIKQLQDSIRFLHILKHRFGMADRVLAVSFFGSVGKWACLPLPDQITDYEPYRKLS